VLLFGHREVTHAQYSNSPIVDLSSIDLSNSIFELDTTWAFYWSRLIPPTEVNNQVSDTLLNFTTNWANISGIGSIGYATYHLDVILSNNPDDLAIDIPDFYSAYRLFINGEEVARNGKVATTKEEYTPHWLPQTIPLSDISTDTLSIVIHVANFDHSKGGAYLPLTIGGSSLLLQDRYIQYGYSFILTGILFMGGLFFLGLFLFGRHDKSILYFSLFCLVYSYRIIGFGSYAFHMLMPELPWLLTLRLEYISLFLSGYLFGLYTLHLYPNETYKPLVYVLSAVSIIFGLQSLLLPPSIFTQLVVPYFILLIFYLGVAFWVYFKAVINQRPGAIYSLISSGAVFIVFGYEILVYLGYFKTSLFINFSGYLFFFFFQSLVHSFRFSNNMKTALRKAEESSKAKSQFLSTMSHEIRTPLNAVIGLSGLLSDSSLTPRQQEFSITIKKSGESLLSIINNILDFSKIESGKLELEENEFNLRETIEHVLELVAGVNSKPELEVLYEIDDEVPKYLIGDAIRLQQILTNLIANAFKFTKDGEILIKLTLEREFTDSMVLQFEVSDTGIGIPEDKLHRLFQSFTQVDSSSTRKYGGTGLGLVISKRLVEAMGGEIKVESKEDHGSTFTFTAVFGRSFREADFTIPSVLENKSVFLLDDNATNLKIIQHQLLKANLKVTTFNNPNMLLSVMNELGSYDFGIIDMQMPEKNGVEVARQIREKYSNQELPLVLFSSIHEIESPNHKSLFELFLKKPILQTQLLNNLERLYLSDVQLKNPSANSINPKHLFKTEFNVLVAEDNIVNQKVAFRILERFGISVDIVKNGKEAFEAEQDSGYDLIFMDMEMPIMDGLEATRKIKEIRNQHSHKPIIIAMTANAMQEDRERCFAAGMDDFIAKPITLQSIKQILVKWLDDN
jgi:signal transduction histidine kinase/CheY-like chemotaxis protein